MSKTTACACNGTNKWIWIILALSIAGVLLARHVRKDASPRGPESCAVPQAATTKVQAGTGGALPRLVDVGAGKCIPCKMMAPILEDLRKTYTGKMDVEFIDIAEYPNSAADYAVRIIPTQIFYDASGKERFRHEGFFDKQDILTKWKELGVELTPGN